MADWVLKAEAVRDSIGILREHSIHPFFPAYLQIRRTAYENGTLVDLRPNWDELGRLLEVAGAPSTHPYFRPFTTGPGESDQEWLNPNLAGSYAPSSLRVDQPAFRVVEKGEGRGRVTLRDNHWNLALEHLLDGETVPITALAAFFLRDFAFEGFDQAPNDDELGGGFALMFGYIDGGTGPTELARLYDSSVEATADWFEEWRGG